MNEGTNEQYILAELAELRAQIAEMGSQLTQAGANNYTAPSLEGRVGAAEKAIQVVERKWAALRGQDGVDINRNVIGFTPLTAKTRQTAIITGCMNGVAAYLIVDIEGGPSPL